MMKIYNYLDFDSNLEAITFRMLPINYWRHENPQDSAVFEIIYC